MKVTLGGARFRLKVSFGASKTLRRNAYSAGLPQLAWSRLSWLSRSARLGNACSARFSSARKRCAGVRTPLAPAPLGNTNSDGLARLAGSRLSWRSRSARLGLTLLTRLGSARLESAAQAYELHSPRHRLQMQTLLAWLIETVGQACVFACQCHLAPRKHCAGVSACWSRLA